MVQYSIHVNSRLGVVRPTPHRREMPGKYVVPTDYYTVLNGTKKNKSGFVCTLVLTGRQWWEQVAKLRTALATEDAQQLRTVTLRNNQMTPAQVESILNVLAGIPLVELTFTGSEFGDEGTAALANALTPGTILSASLTRLDVSSCNLSGSAATVQLGAAFAAPTCALRSLNLSRNFEKVKCGSSARLKRSDVATLLRGLSMQCHRRVADGTSSSTSSAGDDFELTLLHTHNIFSTPGEQEAMKELAALVETGCLTSLKLTAGAKLSSCGCSTLISDAIVVSSGRLHTLCISLSLFPSAADHAAGIVNKKKTKKKKKTKQMKTKQMKTKVVEVDEKLGFFRALRSLPLLTTLGLYAGDLSREDATSVYARDTLALITRRSVKTLELSSVRMSGEQLAVAALVSPQMLQHSLLEAYADGHIAINRRLHKRERYMEVGGTHKAKLVMSEPAELAWLGSSDLARLAREQQGQEEEEEEAAAAAIDVSREEDEGDIFLHERVYGIRTLPYTAAKDIPEAAGKEFERIRARLDGGGGNGIRRGEAAGAAALLAAGVRLGSTADGYRTFGPEFAKANAVVSSHTGLLTTKETAVRQYVVPCAALRQEKRMGMMW